MALALSVWAATSTKDNGPAPNWESMPKETVTQEVAPAAPALPQEPNAPSAAETLLKPAAATPEADVDLFPTPLRIAIALAVVAMIAYVAVTRLT
jgi:hypothetical protein